MLSSHRVHLAASTGSLQRLSSNSTGGAEVFSVAFSPDGTRIVSGDDQGNVILWDATGAPRASSAFRGCVYLDLRRMRMQ